jgi:hypothetical protein
MINSLYILIVNLCLVALFHILMITFKLTLFFIKTKPSDEPKESPSIQLYSSFTGIFHLEYHIEPFFHQQEKSKEMHARD